VEDAGIRFLDNTNEWHNEWPPLSATGQTTGTALVLSAIEFRLELKDWGELVRLYRVSS
jgi:hypothetical protein